jgi:hypothetical protein
MNYLKKKHDKIILNILRTPSNSDRAVDTNCLIALRSTGKFVF